MIKQYSAIPFITRGNFPFRDKFTIDTDRKMVSFQKRSLNVIGFTNKSIMFKHISLVKLLHRVELIMFSRIIIESTGGNEFIIVSGLPPRDAMEIKYLLDNLR